jgi:hypothetical protein
VSGGPLALTRTFMREAIRKRYMIAAVPMGDIDTKLQDYRVSADAQVCDGHNVCVSVCLYVCVCVGVHIEALGLPC